MRKVLSVLLVAVMLVALAVPAMASEGSPELPGGVEPDSAVPGASGTVDHHPDWEIKSDKYDPATGAGKDAEQAAANAYDAAKEQGVDVSDVDYVNVFDVSAYDGSTKKEGDYSATVAVGKNETGEVACVMYYHGGEWIVVEDFSIDGNYIVFDMDGFCTVAVLYKSVSAPVNPGKTDTTSTGSSSSTGPKSPKTGY